MPPIDYEALKNKVDRAIEKNDASSLDIRYKTIEECKYIQKVAEERLLKHGIYYNALIFAGAAGITLIVAVDAGKDITSFFLIDLKLTLYIVFGAICVIIAICLYIYKWNPKYDTCSRIILESEKCILSKKDSEEPKQPHEKEDETGKVQ